MYQYGEVLSYIDYFSTSREEIGTWVHDPTDFPYLNYSPEMLSFIQKVYQTYLMDAEYLPYRGSHLPHETNLADYIKTADFRVLRAILTYYVKWKRIKEGLWLLAIQDGIYNNILMRLHEMLMTGVMALDKQCKQ